MPLIHVDHGVYQPLLNEPMDGVSVLAPRRYPSDDGAISTPSRLVAELDIESADDAESIFSAYYPGDGLNDRVYALVERAVAHRAAFLTTELPDVELRPNSN